MDVVCPSCNLVLREPKGLSCNHPMCSGCLKHYVENAFHEENGKYGVTCLRCQTFSAIPNPNKPINHWSDDFPLLDDVTNEINELKLMTKAVVPSLRHNMNVWIHRNLQPVPLFTLAKTNQEYTFNTTWPNMAVNRDVFQQEQPPQLFLPRKPINCLPYRQNNNITALSIFSSVIPKIQYLISSTEIGARAITAGNELYEIILAKTRPEVVSAAEPYAIMTSCEDNEENSAQIAPENGRPFLPASSFEQTDLKNQKRAEDEPIASGETLSFGNDVSLLDEPVKSNSEYFGRSMSYEQTLEQKQTEQEYTTITQKSEQEQQTQYVKVENTYNYYTTNIYMTSTQESTASNPAVISEASREQTTTAAAIEIIAGKENSSENVRFLNETLIHPLQGPNWAIPNRPVPAVPEMNRTWLGCGKMKNEWMEKLLSSFNQQVERFKSSMNSCRGTETEQQPKVSKRAETMRKNKQDRKRFGINWRQLASRERRHDTSRDLTGTYDSKLFNFSLMKYDKKS